MKKHITKFRFWVLKKLMKSNDLQLLLLGADICDDWVNNRSLRRKLKDSNYDARIKAIIKKW